MPDNPKSDVGRITKRSEFLAVQRGDRLRGRFFLLEIGNRGDDAAPRVGFTVTRKQGNAVERNRIRRRLREVVRNTGARDMCAGNDYVIVGRREILAASFEDLNAELSSRLRNPRAAKGANSHKAV